MRNMNLASKGQWAISGFHEDQMKGVPFTPLCNFTKKLLFTECLPLHVAVVCMCCANHIKYSPLGGSSDYLHLAYL